MRASHFSLDTQEFIKLLAYHKVKYVIVGGEAVIYYGHARLTGDVGFFSEHPKPMPRVYIMRWINSGGEVFRALRGIRN